jgi:hypothetical protein
VLELSSTLTPATSTTTPPPVVATDAGGATPRVTLVSERAVPPPSGPAEARDYHAALAGMLKPRRLR